MVWRIGLLLEAAVPNPGREAAERGRCGPQGEFWGVPCPGAQCGARAVGARPGCGSVLGHQVAPPPRSPRRPFPTGLARGSSGPVSACPGGSGGLGAHSAALPGHPRHPAARGSRSRARVRGQEVPVLMPRPSRASAPWRVSGTQPRVLALPWGAGPGSPSLGTPRGMETS